MNPANVADMKKIKRDVDPKELAHDQNKVDRIFKDAAMQRRILARTANPK